MDDRPRSGEAERPGPRGSETRRRIWVAIPAIVFAIAIVAAGGRVFAVGLVVLGLLALHELYTVMGEARPVKLAGFIAMAGLVAAALFGDHYHVVLALVGGFLLTFLLAMARGGREHMSRSIAVTLLGVIWVGLALAHAVLLRELPHGDGLMIDVLVGTLIGDSAAYFGGRAYGRRPLAPRISPNKTLEGLVFGVVAGTLAFWFAGTYQDWFDGTDALIVGLAVAVATPLGDLFESLIKRDVDVKDTGSFFGPHGGVLDRLDALLFTVVTAYYVSVAVLP